MALLKKNKETDSDDVPEELPPLGDESAQTGENIEEVPDELPSLDLPTPDEMASEKPEKPPKKEESKKPEPPKEPVDDKDSFFSDIMQKLHDDKITENLLESMKEYWEKQKAIHDVTKSAVEQELEYELNEKIRELQDLEKEWVQNVKTMKQAQHTVIDLEAKIEVKSEELKSVAEKIDRVRQRHKKISDNLKPE